MFMGEHRHGIDDKGRLTMPRKYREQLGPRFVLTKGLDGCLFVYPTQEWQLLTSSIQKLPLTNASARAFVRLFMAGACESELDRQGRFLIPSSLREYASLDRESVICGVETVWKCGVCSGGRNTCPLRALRSPRSLANWWTWAYEAVRAMTLYHHTPVLLKETLDLLDCRSGDTVLDATIGGAGHSAEIAKRIMPGGRLIGIDRDQEAVKVARLRLRDYGDRVSVVHGNFRDLARIVSEMGIHTVDRVLFDFGASSAQFDDAERGFSYRPGESLLDMRMDRSQAESAADLVNNASLEELTSIIREFGEEPFAERIARFIVERRRSQRINSVGDLVEIVKAAIPARFRRRGGHPARRTFQALRIAVNRAGGNRGGVGLRV